MWHYNFQRPHLGYRLDTHAFTGVELTVSSAVGANRCPATLLLDFAFIPALSKGWEFPLGLNGKRPIEVLLDSTCDPIPIDS